MRITRKEKNESERERKDCWKRKRLLFVLCLLKAFREREWKLSMGTVLRMFAIVEDRQHDHNQQQQQQQK